jgi:hypothetical protein
MADYQNTIIYKIICLDTEVKEFYVGHTTNKKQREKCHRDRSNPNHCKSKMKLYDFIINHGGWDRFYIEVIEEYPCTNVKEARTREQYWITELKPELNDKAEVITDEQRRLYKAEWKRNSASHHAYNINYAKNLTAEQKQRKSEKQKEWWSNISPEKREEYNLNRIKKLN